MSFINLLVLLKIDPTRVTALTVGLVIRPIQRRTSQLRQRSFSQIVHAVRVSERRASNAVDKDQPSGSSKF